MKQKTNADAPYITVSKIAAKILNYSLKYSVPVSNDYAMNCIVLPLKPKFFIYFSFLFYSLFLFFLLFCLVVCCLRFGFICSFIVLFNFVLL